MAQQEQNTALTLPHAPQYLWGSFTPQNVERVEKLGSSLDPTVRIADLPQDLMNLQPPAEPADGVWRIFGNRYTLKDELPSLEEQGITRLGPQPATAAMTSSPSDNNGGKPFDKVLELKKLSKSILLNFLELMGTLAVNPEQAEDKNADLRTLFINMHHTINEWRPHQAREALVGMMQDRLEKTRGETTALREATENAKRVLKGLGDITVPDDAALLGGPSEKAAFGEWTAQDKKEAERLRNAEVWAAMDALFD